MMKEQETQSQVLQERLKQLIDKGIEQADRGDVVGHDTVFRQLKARAAEMTDTER